MIYYSYLPYVLQLNSPAIIKILGGDPNSSSTLSYIPGTAVRGVLATALGDPGGDNSRKQEFHDLVLGDKVSYLNAYPIVDGRRALPTPASLRLKKDELENNRDVTDLSACDLNSWPKEELIPIGEDFTTIGAAQPVLYSPKINSRIHNQRDREKGRAWKEKGAIFSFEFLDTNQMFGGLIQLCSEQEDELEAIESRVKELLGETLLVGRSRRAGYGGLASVVCGVRQKHELVGGGKEGLQPLTRDIGQGEQFRLLLTSPCIVRDLLTGQIDPAALMDRIVSRFDNRVEVMRKVWAFETVGGFNRKWRLELPQTLAVSAGSVFVLKANQTITLNELHEIEHEGFGERKGEGYGRLLFLDKPQPKISIEKFIDSPSETVGAGLPPEIVTNIESRIIHAQLARRIEEKAAELVECARNRPSNSLIGRLRTPLRGEAHEAISILKLWLAGNEAAQLKRPAMEQLELCKFDDGKDLRKWILDVMDKDTILNLLKVGVLAQRFYVVSEQSVKRRVDMKSEELSVRLIDAVLADLAIRNKREEVTDGQ
jgi:CRISPR-associated protein Csx10